MSLVTEMRSSHIMEANRMEASNKEPNVRNWTIFFRQKECLYIIRNPNDPTPNLYKIGRTTDLKRRLASFRTYMPSGPALMFTVRCIDSKLCEEFLKTYLRPQRINGGEWVTIDLEHLKTVMTDICRLGDALSDRRQARCSNVIDQRQEALNIGSDQSDAGSSDATACNTDDDEDISDEEHEDVNDTDYLEDSVSHHDEPKAFSMHLRNDRVIVRKGLKLRVRRAKQTFNPI